MESKSTMVSQKEGQRVLETLPIQRTWSVLSFSLFGLKKKRGDHKAHCGPRSVNLFYVEIATLQK